MRKLKDLTPGTSVKGILSDSLVTAVNVHLRQPFHREPDFGATRENYNFGELLSRVEKAA